MRIFKSLFPIIFFLLISFFSISKPPLSYADTPTITYAPSHVYSNSGSVVFTISFPPGSTDTFKNSTWSFGIWPQGTDTGSIAYDGSTITYTTSSGASNHIEMSADGGTLTANVYLVGVLYPVRNYTYIAWPGGYLTQNDFKQALANHTTVVGQYAVHPPDDKDANGNSIGVPGWIIYNIVKAGQPTNFIVANINPDTIYTIYIDGAVRTEYIGKLGDYKGKSGEKTTIQLDYSYQGSTPSAAAILPITIDNPGTNKIFCLKMGQTLGVPSSWDCNYPSPPFNVVSYIPTGFPVMLQSSETIGIPDPDALLRDNTLPDVPVPCETRDVNGKCTEVNTALGIISTDPQVFVKYIFGVVLGLAGGIALILIILAGYKLMVSQGNPEKMKAATEGLTSSIIGLLFIIFAFVILQIVGVDILRIPGFAP